MLTVIFLPVNKRKDALGLQHRNFQEEEYWTTLFRLYLFQIIMSDLY